MEPDFASCRAVTRAHGRSFYFTSFALPADRREAAFALYAFFRRLDDAFDLNETPANSETTGKRKADEALLAEARAVVDSVFGEGPLPESEHWPKGELAALRQSVRLHALPKEPFVEMVNGMEMDLYHSMFNTESELALYCDRVAGTVGLLMSHLLGGLDARALASAQLMGRAMQLTNILRDVAEDLGRGRLYLPLESLQAAGISRLWPDAGAAVRASMPRLIEQRVRDARAVYAEAEKGIAYLPTRRGRYLVLLMGRVYAAILDVLEERRFDVFSGRASTSFWRKMGLALRCVPVLLGGR